MFLRLNPSPDPISDEDLIRGFLLNLGPSGRKPKTLEVYGDSVRMLSDFARCLGLPPLAEMTREHVRPWMTSLSPGWEQARHCPRPLQERDRFFRIMSV